MTAKRKSKLASIAVGATILVWFSIALMIIFVPRIAAYWAELGTPLSFAQRLLLVLCGLAQQNVMTIGPALLTFTAAALWWRVSTSKRMRTAPQTPQA